MAKLLEYITFLGIKIITLNYLVVKNLINKYKGKPKKVLDLGSGNGYLSTLFTSNGYLGYEIDSKLVNEAKFNYPKYHFRVGDITKIDIGRKFDLILIIGVIHHLNDEQFDSVLKVINRHIDKKGKILIIEAIPPISKYNFVGKLIRNMDRGNYVRSMISYKSKLNKKFKVVKALNVKGGFIDYAFFILVN